MHNASGAWLQVGYLRVDDDLCQTELIEMLQY
jgi:hypothetical protein